MDRALAVLTNIGPTLKEIGRALARRGSADPSFDVYSPPNFSVTKYGLSDRGDVRAMLKAFRSIVFACVNARATDVANKAKFFAYEERGPEDLVELPLGHPLNLLLRKPNPEITRYVIMYNMIAHLDISGNSYHWISRDGRNNPTALWPIPPQYVRIIPGDPKKREPIIKGYEIDWGGGNVAPVAAEDMLHLRHPNPANPYYYGSSLMMRAAVEIDIAEYINQYRKEFFKNDAMPAGVVVFPKEAQVNDDMLRRFDEEWRKKFNRKPGSWAMLEGGADAKILGGDANTKEFGFLESWGINTGTIRSVFGVTQARLMQEQKIEARATAETMDYIWHSGTIDPLLNMVSEQLTLDLAIPLFGERFVIRHKSTIPADEERDAKVDGARITSGTLTINEARKRRGEDELEGGDRAFVPINVMPLDEWAAEGAAPKPAGGGGGGGAADDGEEDDDGAGDDQEGKALVLDDVTKRAYWKVKDGFRSRWELRVFREVRRFFAEIKDEVMWNVEEQRTKALAGLVKAEGDDEPLTASPGELTFDLQKAIARLRGIMTAQSLRVLQSAFDEFVDRYQVRGVIYAPNDNRVQTAVVKINAKTVTVPKTLHDELYAELDEGIRLQETAEQIAGRVRRFFADGSEFKSMRIARTVSNFAVNEGNRIAAQDADYTDKIWITMRDDRVRDLHDTMDGKEIPLDQAFILANGDALSVPGDPAASQGESVINCRCTLFYTQKARRRGR